MSKEANLAYVRAKRARAGLDPTDLELTPEHQRVYSGGHHDVYCDKKTHFWGFGGYVWNVERSEFIPDRQGPCDCARY